MGFSSARNLGRDISAGFSPPRRMPISEAVKKFMRVPKGAGNSVPWDPELTPYIIEPMNCLASREYDAVIFVGPARTGKTIGLIDGWIVYTIVCDPSDMLVVQMTEDKAREHSKKRLDRTFRSSAAVKKRMSPRRNDNNVHDKTFRDGSFLKIGWPSVNIMSSSDCRELNIWLFFSSERQSLMPKRENCRRLNDGLLFCGWGWISMPGWFPAHCGMRNSLRMLRRFTHPLLQHGRMMPWERGRRWFCR